MAQEAKLVRALSAIDLAMGFDMSTTKNPKHNTISELHRYLEDITTLFWPHQMHGGQPQNISWLKIKCLGAGL